MNTATIERAFEKMGAPFEILETAGRRRWTRQVGLSIDVVNVHVRKGRELPKEVIQIDIPLDHSNIEAQVLDVQPKLRHLVLQVRNLDERGRTDTVTKFLVGHDERHWFAAGVDLKVTTVAQALDSLKPVEVHILEKLRKVPRSRRNKHSNKAFVRQGEWFFVPAALPLPMEKLILLEDEPISRGRGSKPHMCEYLVRTGGVSVWVHSSKAPNGVSYEEYMKMAQKEDGKVDNWGWRNMMADAAVYVRGRVSHPDHATITLNEWHKVIMSSEQAALAAGLRFLD